MRRLSKEEFLGQLREKIQTDNITQTRASQIIGVRPAYLNDVLRSRKPPSEKVLNYVGYTSLTSIVPLDSTEENDEEEKKFPA